MMLVMPIKEAELLACVAQGVNAQQSVLVAAGGSGIGDGAAITRGMTTARLEVDARSVVEFFHQLMVFDDGLEEKQFSEHI